MCAKFVTSSVALIRATSVKPVRTVAAVSPCATLYSFIYCTTNFSISAGLTSICVLYISSVGGASVCSTAEDVFCVGFGFSVTVVSVFGGVVGGLLSAELVGSDSTSFSFSVVVVSEAADDVSVGWLSVREDNCSCENVSYTGYGVNAVQNGIVVKSFADIFFSKEKAVAFIEMLNSQKVELIHLKDVVEDALI